MITSLTLVNFQSHRHTSLRFHDGVNVIVGSSNSGKTAILRGLNWLMNNRPLGLGILRHGQKSCRVTVTMGTGRKKSHIITRKRTKVKNVYRVDGETLAAFAGSVPDAVQKAIGLSEINVQRQLDPPFLLSESSGVAARVLNKATGLDRIDMSLSYLNSQKLETGKKLISATDSVNALKSGLKACPCLTEVEGLLQRLGGLETELEKTRKTEKELKGLIEYRDRFQDRMTIPIDVAICETVSLKLKECEAREQRAKDLEHLLDLRAWLNQEILTLNLFLKSLEEKKSKIKTCPTCGQSIRA